MMKDSIKQERRHKKFLAHSALNEAILVSHQSSCFTCGKTDTDIELLKHEAETDHKIKWNNK